MDGSDDGISPHVLCGPTLHRLTCATYQLVCIIFDLPSLFSTHLLDDPQMLSQTHSSQEQPFVSINCQVSIAVPRNNLQID